jgi:hypothetical protein
MSCEDLGLSENLATVWDNYISELKGVGSHSTKPMIHFYGLVAIHLETYQSETFMLLLYLHRISRFGMDGGLTYGNGIYN